MIMEPILKENPGRFVIFPLKYHDIWNFYKKAEANLMDAKVGNSPQKGIEK